MGKYVALWDFETEQEGKKKAGEEFSLSSEDRIRELREKRLIQEKEVYDKRNAPPPPEKKVAKKKEETK